MLKRLQSVVEQMVEEISWVERMKMSSSREKGGWEAVNESQFSSLRRLPRDPVYSLSFRILTSWVIISTFLV